MCVCVCVKLSFSRSLDQTTTTVTGPSRCFGIKTVFLFYPKFLLLFLDLLLFIIVCDFFVCAGAQIQFFRFTFWFFWPTAQPAVSSLLQGPPSFSLK